MSRILAVLAVLTTATGLAANDTVYRTGRTTYRLPFTVPSHDAVTTAAGFGSPDARVEVSLRDVTKAEPRFYPMIGPAILHTATFDCVVEESGRRVRVSIDRNRFVRASIPNDQPEEATP